MLGLVRVQPSMIFRVPISEKKKEKDKTKEKERNVKDKREDMGEKDILSRTHVCK